MLTLRRLDVPLTVCKVEDYALVDLSAPFTFTGATDEENSLVCPSSCVPANALEREDGWRALRIEGTLDFSLVGILAPLATLLANAHIGIFAISTFNTDYVLVKDADFAQACILLADAGYSVV